MNAQHVTDGLNILQTQMARILDQHTVERTLGKAREEVRYSEKLYHKYSDRSDLTHRIEETGWGFEIKSPALRFKETEINGYRFYVDVICEFRWKGDALCKRNLVLRLWSRDPSMSYRPEWDSDIIGDLVTNELECLEERVMLRFHFDMAAKGVSELKDHLQVGGVSQAGEYCWLPSQIDVPRFPYPPVDLFLICELIGANFYEKEYNRLRTDSTWIGQIRRSQVRLLKEYYGGCCQAIEEGKSVLMDQLWQTRPASA